MRLTKQISRTLDFDINTLTLVRVATKETTGISKRDKYTLRRDEIEYDLYWNDDFTNLFVKYLKSKGIRNINPNFKIIKQYRDKENPHFPTHLVVSVEYYGDAGNYEVSYITK